MSDFEHRLWQQLEAAAEREARRGGLPRLPALSRPRQRRALVVLAAVPVALLVLAVLVLAGTLRRQAPPAEHAPAPIRLHVAQDLGSAAAGDGAVWLHSPQDGVLLRLDPAQRRVTDRIAVGGPQPDAAVAVAPGAVWAISVRRAGHNSLPATRPGTLLRIDPRSGHVVARIAARAPGGPPIEPAGVSVVGDAVWVWGPGGAVRVDPRTNRAVLEIPVADEDVRGFTGLGSRVWMATETASRLLRFNARTGARTLSTPIPPRAPQRAMAALPGVVVLDARDGTISGVDASTGRETWHTPIGAGIGGMTLVGDVLWLTAIDPAGGDRLLGLDARTGRVATRVVLPVQGTRAVVAVGRELWITTAAGDVLIARP